MKVQPIPTDEPETIFREADLYQSRQTRNIYIGITFKNHNYLVNLVSGRVWPMELPGAEAFATSFVNVTNLYILKGVEK